MKLYEIYSKIELPENYYYVVRLDGWKFHKITNELKLKKPFDLRLVKALSEGAKKIMENFNGELAYIFSDEINILFKNIPEFKRIEKIDSIFAGIVSSIFSLKFKKSCVFDCRCIVLPKNKIIDYFKWRHKECVRNFYNALARHVLMTYGKMNSLQAAKKLYKVKIKKLHKICLDYGIDLDEVQKWKKNGVLIYWRVYEKQGFDPIKKKKVKVKRRKIKINFNFNGDFKWQLSKSKN